MPTASSELRERMNVRFGDPVAPDGPMKFLTSRGWKSTCRFEWMKEGFSRLSWNDIPEDERECMQFLGEEWDFGGITDYKKED